MPLPGPVINVYDGIQGIGVFLGGGGGAGTTVFPLGDSYTEGLEGNTGGWRAKVQTAGITFVGPYMDPTGRKHGGRGGDCLISASLPDMADRIASQWASTPAVEVWLEGGTNDKISDGDTTATLLATSLSQCLDAIIAAVGNSVVIRVDSIPPINTADDPTFVSYWRDKIAQVVAAKRAAGAMVVFQHAGGQLAVGDLAASVTVQHPSDGAYGAPGTNGGYGTWAYAKDQWFNPSLAVDPSTLTPAFWYRGDTCSFSSGVTLSSWTDLSGNGRHPTPTSTAPTQVDGAYGQKAIRFNSSALRNTTGSWSLTQPNTIYMFTGPVNATGSPALFDSATSGARHLLQVAVTTGVPTLAAATSANDADLNAQTIGHLWCCEFNGTATKLNLDGNPRNQAMSAGTQAMTGITIGGSLAGTPSNLLTTTDVYELIGFNAAHTAAQKFAIAHYFNNRYRIWGRLGQKLTW